MPTCVFSTSIKTTFSKTRPPLSPGDLEQARKAPATVAIAFRAMASDAGASAKRLAAPMQIDDSSLQRDRDGMGPVTIMLLM